MAGTAGVRLLRDTRGEMYEESATPDLKERHRVFFEDANRADFTTTLDSYADDAVWVMPTQIFAGRAAILGHWQEWYESYENFWFGPPDVVDLGKGVVLVVVRQGGRLRGGTAELSQQLALVYEWSNGLVVKVTASFDIDQARAGAERLAKGRG